MEITPFQGFYSYQPLIPDIPSAPAFTGADTSGSKSESSSKDDKGSIGGLSKEMINTLIEKGLPSDVSGYLTGMAAAIEHAYDPITGKPNLAAYQLLLPKLAEVVKNREEMKEAEKSLMEKNAKDDYATTPDGKVLTLFYDENNNPQREWLKPGALVALVNEKGGNWDSVHIITNGELVALRSNDPRFAFDPNSLNVLASGTGMQDIANYIRQELPNLGSSSHKVTYQQGGQTAIAGAEQFAQSVEALQSLMDSGFKTMRFDENQMAQAGMALNYLIRLMPDNMRAQLEIRGAKTGQTAMSILQSYIGARMSSKTEEFNMFGKPGGKSSDDGNGGNLKMTAPMVWAQGYGVPKNIYWNTSNTTFALPIPTVMGTITSKNNPIGPYTTLTEVAKSDFGTVLDTSRASFAGVSVDAVMSNNILVNAGELYKVKLPLDQEAYALGRIQPDMKLLDRLQEVEREIVYRNITKADDINAIYQREGLPVEYSQDAQGNRSYKFTGPSAYFGAMEAYMPKQAFINSDQIDQLTSSAVEIVDEPKRKEIEKLLKSQVAKEGQTSFDGSTGLFVEDALYQSMIYIPLNEHWAAQMGTNSASEMPTVSQAKNVLEPLQQQSDRQRQLQSIIKPQI